MTDVSRCTPEATDPGRLPAVRRADSRVICRTADGARCGRASGGTSTSRGPNPQWTHDANRSALVRYVVLVRLCASAPAAKPHGCDARARREQRYEDVEDQEGLLVSPVTERVHSPDAK